MKITFDGQTIEYKIEYVSKKAGVLHTNITFPNPLSLKNESRMEALQKAVLQEHDHITQFIISKVAKDGKVKNKVNSIFKENVHFDDFDDAKLSANTSVLFTKLVVGPHASGKIKLGDTTLVIGTPKP